MAFTSATNRSCNVAGSDSGIRNSLRRRKTVAQSVDFFLCLGMYLPAEVRVPFRLRPIVRSSGLRLRELVPQIGQLTQTVGFECLTECLVLHL